MKKKKNLEGLKMKYIYIYIYIKLKINKKNLQE